MIGTTSLAVANAIPPPGQDLWRAQIPDGIELACPDEPDWPNVSILVARHTRVGTELLDRLPGLRLMQQVGRFPTLVNIPECRARGVVVATWPLLSRITVAEHAIGLMLAVARSLGAGERATRAADYRAKRIAPVRTTETVIAWNWMQLPVIELYGKTVGLLGAGEIALEVAGRAQAFGMHVTYTNRRRLSEVWERSLRLSYRTLDDLLAGGDVVSVHLPFTPETAGLMGRAQFARMKPGTILVNTARGGVIDEMALCKALESGRLRGAGLDVFVEEPLPAGHRLLALPNAFLSPHLGGGEAGGLLADLKRLYSHLQKVAGGALPTGVVEGAC